MKEAMDVNSQLFQEDDVDFSVDPVLDETSPISFGVAFGDF